MCTFFDVTLTHSNRLDLKLSESDSLVVPLSFLNFKISKPFIGEGDELFFENVEEIQMIMSHIST